MTLWIPVLPTLLSAEESSLPAWRRGVSQWNGTEYEQPEATIASSADAVAGTDHSGPVSPPTPYTVPVDPSSTPLVDPPSTQPNPFFQLPEKVEDSALELKSPVALPSPGPQLTPPSLSSSPPSETTNFEPITIRAESSKPGETGTKSLQPLPPPVKPKDVPGKEDSIGRESSKISDQIATGDGATEPAPLETEVIRWYQYPRRWMRGWDSHAEFGLDGSDGNADTLAIQTGLELKRKTDLYSLGIDIDYRQVMARNATTEDNGRLNIDYDRMVGDSPWSAFAKFGLEWDRFKAFDLRLNVNGGVGYHWIRTESTTLVTRFGAGASKEIGAPDDDWIAEAVFGIEAERQLTARQKLKGKMDYFPAWADFGDYRLVSDVAWEILLDGSENLSLKLAATDRYDSTPQGFEPNDLYYSMLLLYKF